MIFNPDTPGLYPSLVFDGDGKEIAWVISGDTETGECVVSIRDADGGPLINHLEGECVRERRCYKAPLRLEKFGTHYWRRYGKPLPDHVDPPYEFLERLGES